MKWSVNNLFLFQEKRKTIPSFFIELSKTQECFIEKHCNTEERKKNELVMQDDVYLQKDYRKRLAKIIKSMTLKTIDVDSVYLTYKRKYIDAKEEESFVYIFFSEKRCAEKNAFIFKKSDAPEYFCFFQEMKEFDNIVKEHKEFRRQQRVERMAERKEF